MTTSPPLCVAVAQFAPGRDRVANMATIARLARRAVSRGASIVVFPEYSSFFADDFGPDFLENAESLDGQFVGALAALAIDLKVYLVAGMIETTDAGERFSNTLVAVSASGEVIASYRKLHLYDAFGSCESEWVEPAPVTPPEMFSVGSFTVGMQTCYDIRFPEVTRRLVDAGAEVVLVPADWVRGPLKENHWRTLMTARAIENTIYVAATDHTAPTGIGTSLIVDPMGVVLAALGENEDVALAWLDRARLDAVRAVNPALSLRRFTTRAI